MTLCIRLLQPRDMHAVVQSPTAKTKWKVENGALDFEGL